MPLSLQARCSSGLNWKDEGGTMFRLELKGCYEAETLPVPESQKFWLSIFYLRCYKCGPHASIFCLEKKGLGG
jgi:hypothetical protein